jgi:hypothetical protein
MPHDDGFSALSAYCGRPEGNSALREHVNITAIDQIHCVKINHYKKEHLQYSSVRADYGPPRW